MNQELKNYVDGARQSGLSDEQIKQNLLGQGWTNSDVDGVMGGSNILNVPTPTKTSDFNMKMIGGALLVLIIGTVFSYFFFDKIKTASQSSKVSYSEYVSEGNLFTVSYPSNWTMTPGQEKTYSVRFVVDSNPQMNEYKMLTLAAIPKKQIDDLQKIFATGKEYAIINEEKVSFGGVSSRKIVAENVTVKTVKLIVYIIPDVYEGYSIAASTDTTNQDTIEEIEKMLNTISIDTEVFPNIKHAYDTESKNSALRANMSSLRPSAELYYDANSTSGYKGLCKSNSRDNFGKTYNTLKGLTENKIRCNDSNTYFIVSSQFADDTFWCIDSTGAFTKTAGYHTGNTCEANSI